MKKNAGTALIIIAAVAVVTALAAGIIWGYKKRASEAENVKKAVAGTQWYYDDTADRQHIYFGSDGTYAYWCDCGNGVDGHDIYETYEFTKNPKKIKVKGREKSEIIDIISYSDSKLVLRIGDKTIEFLLEES